jgi:hypothetical protein
VNPVRYPFIDNLAARAIASEAMRQHALLAGLALVLVIVGATPAAAQTCNGLPAIGQNSKGNIGANVAFGKLLTTTTGEESNTVGVGAGFTYGSDRAFGTFGLGKTSYTDFEFTTTVVSLLLGGQVAIGSDRPISICPFGKLSGEWAGNVDGGGTDFSSDQAGGGAMVGFQLGSSNSQREIIPTIGISLERFRETAAQPGTRLTTKNNVTVFSAGVGFIFDRRIAVRPAVSYPFGLDGAKIKVTLVATIAYGRR